MKKLPISIGKLILIPVGVTVEVAKGLLSQVIPSAALCVYLDDGKYIEAKRNVINALKFTCESIGADFYEYGVKPLDFDFSGLIKTIDSINPKEIYLETVTGPRILSILLLKIVSEYVESRKIKGYLMLGIEGESVFLTLDIKGFFAKAKDLRHLQRNVLIALENKDGKTEDLAKAVGVSKWTLYKTLSSLINYGLIRRSKKGVYSLTFMGNFFVKLFEVIR